MEESCILHLQKQFQKFSDLYLCHCGRSQCSSLYICGPAVRPSYLIYYILEGGGRYSIEGQDYLLTKGEGFLVPPNREVLLQADGDEPWTYLWVAVDGTRCGACLRSLGLGEDQLTFRYRDDGGELVRLVDTMIASNPLDDASAFAIQGMLCQLFACLARGISPGSSLTQTERRNLYVHRALEYIHNNYGSGITVAEVAQAVALDRSYLFTLFRRVLDISPRDYLTRFRLTRAKEQLAHTDASVSSIAYSCGYQDPRVFTRAFRQEFGVTPASYRREARQELTEEEEGPQDGAASSDSGE